MEYNLSFISLISRRPSWRITEYRHTANAGPLHAITTMNIQFLLKLGKKPHIQEMLDAGHIYINHSSFFKKDIAHGRFDTKEGLAGLTHMNNGMLEFRSESETEWKKLRFEKGKLEQWLNLENFHIYSVYFITKEETKSHPLYELSSEMKSMGDTLIVINNPKEFIHRLEKALKENSYAYQLKSVEYYDHNVSQEKLTPFHKSNNYAYQKEFRLLIKSSSKDPIHLYLGNLS